MHVVGMVCENHTKHHIVVHWEIDLEDQENNGSVVLASSMEDLLDNTSNARPDRRSNCKTFLTTQAMEERYPNVTRVLRFCTRVCRLEEWFVNLAPNIIRKLQRLGWRKLTEDSEDGNNRSSFLKILLTREVMQGICILDYTSRGRYPTWLSFVFGLSLAQRMTRASRCWWPRSQWWDGRSQLTSGWLKMISHAWPAWNVEAFEPDRNTDELGARLGLTCIWGAAISCWTYLF
jgi:hypothetical protein